MAGGVKRPVNIFKLTKTGLPSQVYNWRLWFAVLNFGLLGCARGVDDGLITAAFTTKTFRALIHFDEYTAVERANIQGNMSAMVLLGSVPGSLIASWLCDRIGRLWTMRELCLVWILGIGIFFASGGNLGGMYAGRFIAGIGKCSELFLSLTNLTGTGVGQSVVVGPVYLAEIAPAPIRGLCTCFFASFSYAILLPAWFGNYVAASTLAGRPAQWKLPMSIHFMVAGLILLFSIFQEESPRSYIRRGQAERAIKAMCRIRNLPANHPYVIEELDYIRLSWQLEQETSRGQGFIGILKEIFLTPSNLYRVYLGVMGQLLAQWSGAGSITIYAPNFFSLIGVKGTKESLFASAVFAVVKFVSAVICMLFLVDVIGRKRSLLIGIVLQSISMIYIASFLTSVPQLGVVKGYVLPEAKKAAGLGAIAMIYVSGFGWAMGWNSMQYVLTAELFPLRIRATSTSLIMCAHFVNQYGNARAVPDMLLPLSEGGITPAGTFWTFAALTIIGATWVFFQIPETAGRSLESMDALFQLPWWKIGLFGNKHAEMLEDGSDTEKAESEHAEIVEEQSKIGVDHLGRSGRVL